MKVTRFTMKDLAPLGSGITDPTVVQENPAVANMRTVDDGVLVGLQADPVHPRLVPWSNIAVATLELEEETKKDVTQPDGRQGEKRK